MHTETQLYKKTKFVKNLSVYSIKNESLIFSDGVILETIINGFTPTLDRNNWDLSNIDIKDLKGLLFDFSNFNFIRVVPEFGIELIPKNGWSIRIPVYGDTGGYYCCDLSLQIKYNNIVTDIISIEDAQEYEH